jgi:putative transposase
MSIPLICKEDVAETITVTRTQRIHHPGNDDISYFCHLSKNLWNQIHHLVYPEYKESKYVHSYEDVDKILNNRRYSGYKKDGKYNPDFDNYHKLGATAQQIERVYFKSWKSYLKGIKDYWKNPDKDYTGMPREPKYKKKDGEFILIFTYQQIKFRETKKGNIWMYFPKNKGVGLKGKDDSPLNMLLGNVNNSNRPQQSAVMLSNGFDDNGDYIDSYLVNRLMNGKFDIVRIIPKGTGYWIEIVYDQEVLKNASEIYRLNKDIIINIDTGVENIIAITDNIGSQPIIIKSEIWKAENQWYNKKIAGLNGVYDRQKIGCFLKKDKNGKYRKQQNAVIKDNIRYLTNKTEGHNKKLQIVTENRNNFALDSEHKVSRFIIERALDIKAGTVAFNKNPLWKQKVNIGKRNNQNFVQLPIQKIVDKARYKGEEVGIKVLDHREDHTSKCSFLCSESIEHHDVYMGKRIHRGLFKCSVGVDISVYIGCKKERILDTINADVQGAYNGLRNVDPRFNVLDIMEGVAAHGLVPKRLSISDLMSESYKDLRMSHRLTVGDINCANN